MPAKRRQILSDEGFLASSICILILCVCKNTFLNNILILKGILLIRAAWNAEELLSELCIISYPDISWLTSPPTAAIQWSCPPPSVRIPSKLEKLGPVVYSFGRYAPTQVLQSWRTCRRGQATKIMKGLGHLSYNKTLNSLGGFSLEKKVKEKLDRGL